MKCPVCNESIHPTESFCSEECSDDMEIQRMGFYNAEGHMASDQEILAYYRSKPSDTSNNNGGSTDYYKLNPSWTECGDIIEARDMNYNQGNIFKSAFTFNIGRHEGTDYERELNKIIWFANRELNQLKGNK